MPKKGKEYNEYMRVYMAERYRTRRAKALAYLGGKCVVCGTTADLQLDHIDPRTKTYPADHACHALSETKFWAEIDKCQLLCGLHHVEKSIVDSGKQKARGTHGTISAYRYCRCTLCRDAKRVYEREAKRKRKARRSLE